MRIRGTAMCVCKLCEYSELNEKNEVICKLMATPEKCKNYKYDIFKYEPAKNTVRGIFTKEDFEI